MDNYEIIEESRKGEKSTIENSSIHIYSHLMKFISVKPILPGWIGTISEQSRNLIEITNASYWRDVTNNPSKLAKIKRKAIIEYEDDGNRNGDIQFTIVYNTFSNITMFKDRALLKSYMLSHLDPKKDDMYKYIEDNFPIKIL